MLERLMRRLGYVSPQELEEVRGFYSGLNAAMGYGGDTVDAFWRPDVDIGEFNRNQLIARSRDLINTMPIAKNCSEVVAHKTVGTGIRPMFETGSDDTNELLEDLWENDFVPNVDYFGRDKNFYSFQDAIVRQIFATGDGFLIRRRSRGRESVMVNGRRRSRMRHRTRLQLFVAEQLDSSKIGDNIINGIEYGEDGKRSAYWFFPNNPRERSGLAAIDAQSIRVPAEDVIHAYEIPDDNLSRGLPWIMPSMKLLYQLRQLIGSEVQRKNIEASLAVFLKHTVPGKPGNPLSSRDGGGANSVTDAKGRKINRIGSGTILNLPMGTEIQTASVTSTGGTGEWFTTMLQQISAGMRIPYALATGDLKQANFSSSRMGMISFNAVIRNFQQNVIRPSLLERVLGWFLEDARLNGDIPLLETPPEVTWAFPRREYTDPVKDLQADISEMNIGLVSATELAAQRGKSYNKLLQKIKEEQERREELGLEFQDLAITLRNLDALDEDEEEDENEGEEAENEEDESENEEEASNDEENEE